MSRNRAELSGDRPNFTIETTSELSSTWKSAPNSWGHSLHSLAPYVGGFPPALAHYFIRRYTEVGDTVLDPMCGGGTVPLEAAINNRNGWGNDIFSYAHILTKAKCNPVSDSNFRDYLDQSLAAAESIENEGHKLLENEDLKVFYSDYTLNKLLKLREVVSDEESTKAAYLKSIICGILHGPSEMFLSVPTKDTYSGSVGYVSRYAERNNLSRPRRDIRSNAISKHNRAQKDYVPPWTSSRTRITKRDSRNLPFPSGEADLIITSPPYMAKLDYTWDNWIRLWWLDQDRNSERDNLDITQDVESYRQFIRSTLTEMYRTLSDDSFAVMIVGDVQKQLASGTQTINTAKIISDEANQNTGFETHTVLEDRYDISDRRYVVFNQLKYEYDDSEKENMAMIDRCLILKKGCPSRPSSPKIDWECEPYKE